MGKPINLDPVSLGLSVLQGGLGFIQANKANKEMNNLQRKLKAYETPEEVFKALQATENRLQEGFDPATLSYLTGQTDRAFDSTLSTSKLLGADPNDLSSAFDQKLQGILKIGSASALQNLENFKTYYSALDTVAANKAAEQKSQQDLIKDRIQAAATNKADGVQNIGNGLNSFIGTASAMGMKDLFKEGQKEKPKKRELGYVEKIINQFFG